MKPATAKHRNKTMLCTYLEPAQYAQLGALAKKLERSKADIVREALDMFFTRQREGEKR